MRGVRLGEWWRRRHCWLVLGAGRQLTGRRWQGWGHERRWCRNDLRWRRYVNRWRHDNGLQWRLGRKRTADRGHGWIRTGTPIYSQGGGVLQVGDTYYWYGVKYRGAVTNDRRLAGYDGRWPQSMISSTMPCATVSGADPTDTPP